MEDRYPDSDRAAIPDGDQGKGDSDGDLPGKAVHGRQVPPDR